jgi:glycosyltransferase involved in cell wall biosynthesis
MNKKKVMYYVQPYYLDCCIEIIKELIDSVELHLIIEVSPDSRNATILQFNDLDTYKNIEDLEKVIEENNFKRLSTYIKGCHSAKLLIFKSRRSLDPRNLFIGIELANYIIKNRIDIIHFDGQSARLMYILPLISKKNIYLTIHDPIQHSGEKYWKTEWVRKAYSFIANKIFFYSTFALKQYIKQHVKQNKILYNIPLKPYTYISTYKKNVQKEDQYILFFGRISYYKGIDILVQSIKIVLLTYPDEQFIIAGDFQHNIDLFNEIKNEKNINIINKHIEIEELAEIISKSKFIVCPYRDATQSGVLMTSFAMDKPVIATNVGSFPEYIEHGVNGLLSNPNHIDFAEQILSALNKNSFKIFENNIRDSKKSVLENKYALKNAYESYKR